MCALKCNLGTKQKPLQFVFPMIKTSPDTAPRFVNRSLWFYMGGGYKSKWHFLFSFSGPTARAASFLRFVDHTQWHTTVGRTPEEGSALCRNFYLTTHNTQKRQISTPPSGIRTHSPTKQAAAYTRLIHPNNTYFEISFYKLLWTRNWRYTSSGLGVLQLYFKI